MASLVNTFCVCNWYPEHGLHLVAEGDREAFLALSPAGKVFKCVGQDEPWLVIEHGVNAYRVKAEVLKRVESPKFMVGQSVVANGKSGIIANIMWHFKNDSPFYLLAFNGKQSSRRYEEGELAAAD